LKYLKNKTPPLYVPEEARDFIAQNLPKDYQNSTVTEGIEEILKLEFQYQKEKGKPPLIKVDLPS
jgi:hypothetical protein